MTAEIIKLYKNPMSWDMEATKAIMACGIFKYFQRKGLEQDNTFTLLVSGTKIGKYDLKVNRGWINYSKINEIVEAMKNV